MNEITKEEVIQRLKDIKYSVTIAKRAVETVEMMANDIESDEEAIDIAIEAIENQKTLQEELEKIKAEIQEEIEDYLMEVDYIRGVKDGFLFSAEIVDKHISELKGDD